MSVCSSGVSQPKAGVVDTLIYAAGAVSLVTIPPSYKWLIPIVPLLGNVAYHTPDFCAADPPAQPTFTSAEYNAFLTLSFDANYWSFLSKVKDAVGNLVWYSICECASVVTPAQPALPAPPSPTTFVPASTASGA